MASNNNTIYQTPPLAGRPPFATDDDHLYDNQPQPATRRLAQPKPEDPNARTSAYNVYVTLSDPADLLFTHNPMQLRQLS